jgi:hypothetical protein
VIAVSFRSKRVQAALHCHFEYPFPIFMSDNLFLTKDYEMPKRLKAEAVDPAESRSLERSTRANVIQLERGFSFEVRPSQRLHLSDGGDPGPAGFDWNELERF